MKIKASRFTPKEFHIIFTLLLKKSSIFLTYPGGIPFPGNKKPAFHYIECRTGGLLSLHGSQMKKANEETWISKFIFLVWYLIPFLSSFYKKKKVGKECLKKKRAKWRKGKERLQIANNHSYCLDVSSLSVHLPEVSAPKVFNSQCIIECLGLIAGIH